MRTKFWWESLKRRDHCEVLNVNGSMILDWIFKEVRWELMDWIHLAWNRNQWWAHVNIIVYLASIKGEVYLEERNDY